MIKQQPTLTRHRPWQRWKCGDRTDRLMITTHRRGGCTEHPRTRPYELWTLNGVFEYIGTWHPVTLPAVTDTSISNSVDIGEHELKKAVLSQGGPRDDAENFGMYRSLQRLRGWLRKTHFLQKCVPAVQGYPRSLILVWIENAYATSYWSVIVSLVQSCLDSEIRSLLEVFAQ